MVRGIGIDILKIQRLKDSMETSGEIFMKKVFTPYELENSQNHPNPISYLAKTFSAKEAIFKLFDIGWDSGAQLSDIEIRTGQFGEPVPYLYNKFEEIFKSSGGSRIHISVSYEDEYAVAVAILG